VFGGGIEVRPFAAAAYYRDGLVRKILVSNAREGPGEQLGVLLTNAAANRAVLLKLGARAEAIESFGYNLRNTHDRQWRCTTGPHNTISVGSSCRSRFSPRAGCAGCCIMSSASATVLVPALDPPEYRDDDWWQDEAGVISFQNEVLKYFYYRLKY
jgi:hypothetical protein